MVSFDTVQPGWCGIDQDDSFGPVLKGCRENFDFTLVFEESILSLAPSAFLLLLVPARLVQLWGSRKKVRRGFWQLSRSIAFCILLSQIIASGRYTYENLRANVRLEETTSSFQYRKLLVWSIVISNVSVGAHSSQVDITEMKPLAATKSSISKGTAISVVDATFGWTKSGQATLKEINIVIQASSTEEHVFNNVFGPEGLLNNLGTTVIVVTDKSHRLSSANHIIAIGQQQKVLEQGDFTQLKSAGGGGYVTRLLSQGEPNISVEKKENIKPEKEAITIKKNIETATTTELDNKRQKGDLSTYKYFCNASGPRNVALALIMAVLSAFCMVYSIIIPRSKQILHQNILKSTLEAPLSSLTTTDVGTTMNRIVLTIMRAIILCITAKYFAVIIPFGLVAVYLIQRYYLFTSHQLRLLDIEAKAPLYSHFLENLDGLATIRAYGWQKALLLACIQRWLAFVLDILTAVFVIIVVVFAVTVRSSMTAADVGVALANIVSTNQALTMLIISWTGLETAIEAVSRVRSFSRDTPFEVRQDVEEIDLEEWRSSGAISLENVSASYR
ncbi:hypothetical protein SS1G_13082 [Sclerotinia sclerotiorum 1980 UF-70]|uniref:ABC transmembrane type-1 domain-containing protein n=1 Tax=Sclerotinia sclerotiorum (strain ATCC 18683 / 1980 / Ss-1) TaxID=665079 RepID=A7F654_SCLS1|nr:hypothetical protein SS1G_13082 [Sclerotinia sclerotiorum 1980 UF-70]EDN98225.1 hypothetical protein SS1G_13082 [Sclerotinia sclerotiorum 1980 UF-70]